MADPAWSPPAHGRLGPGRRTYGVWFDAEHLALLVALAARFPPIPRYRIAGRSDTLRALIMATPDPRPDLLIPRRMPVVRLPTIGEWRASHSMGSRSTGWNWDIPREPRTRRPYLALSLDPDALDRLHELARATGRSKAAIVSMLVLEARVVEVRRVDWYQITTLGREDPTAEDPAPCSDENRRFHARGRRRPQAAPWGSRMRT